MNPEITRIERQNNVFALYSLTGSGIVTTVSFIAFGILLSLYLSETYRFSLVFFAIPGSTASVGFIGIVISGVALCCNTKSENIETYPAPHPEPAPAPTRITVLPPPPLNDDDGTTSSLSSEDSDGDEVSDPTSSLTPSDDESEKLGGGKEEEATHIENKPLPVAKTPSPFQTIPLHRISMKESKSQLYERVCKRWVENAATRVFQNPLRSFLELVANALDASVPSDPIGNLGLGFLSILSFLAHKETEGCQIVITTTYEESGALFSYAIKVFKEEGIVKTNFIKIENKDKTGTVITILPNKGSFSEETLSQIKKYLFYLQFYPHGTIAIKEALGTSTIGNGLEILAKVTLLPHMLSVADEGCGILLSVAYNHLFIPSSSTKKRALESDFHFPEFVEYLGKKNQASSSMLFSIQGVVIIEVPLDIPIYSSKKVVDIHIRMSSLVPFTVARDSIDLENPITESYLKLLVDEVAHRFTLKRSMELCSLLYGLYKGFQKLENRNSIHSRFLASSYLLQTLHKLEIQSDLIAAPFEDYAFFATLLGRESSCLLPSYPEMHGDFENLEQTILKRELALAEKEKESVRSQALRGEVIEGKNVLVIDQSTMGRFTDKTASTFGTLNLLFVSSSIFTQGLAISKEEMAMMLINHYSEEGRQIQPCKAEGQSLRQEEHYVLFLSPPHLQSDEITEDVYLPDLATKKISTPPFYLIQNSPLFLSFPDAVFKDFEAKYGVFIQQELWVNPIFSSFSFLDAAKKETCAINDYFVVRAYIPLTDRKKPPTFFNTWHNFYYLKEGSLLTEQQEKLSFKELRKKKVLEKLDNTQIAKIFFFSLLTHFLQDPEKDRILLSNGKTLWPIEGEWSVEKLEELLLAFYRVPFAMGKNIYDEFPDLTRHFFIRSVFSPHLQSVTPQMQKTLNTFAPFKNFLTPNLPPNFYSLTFYIFDITLLLEFIHNSSSFSKENKCSAALYLGKLLLSYRKYFEFSDNELSAPYGHDQAVVVSSGNYYESCSMIHLCDLLEQFKDEPPLFAKALCFLQTSIEERLNVHTRNAHMQRESVIRIYSILNFNGIAILALLKAHPSTKKTLLELCRTHDELLLMTVAYGIFTSIEDPERINKILKNIIENYVRKRISAKELKKLFSIHERNPSSSPIKEPLEKLIEPMKKYLSNMETGEVACEFIPPSILSQMAGLGSFCCSQLLHAISLEEFEKLLEDRAPPSVMTTFIARLSKNTPFQVIKESIQSGSEKRYVESAVLIPFQNSVDAIRKFSSGIAAQKKNARKKDEPIRPIPRIDFQVGIVCKDGQAQCFVEIRDYVGMETISSLFLHLLVPGFNDKTNKVSSSFFQLFREEEKITVKTRLLSDPAQLFFIEITPILDAKGEAFDAEIKIGNIAESAETDFFGTEIRVLFRNTSQSVEDIEMEVSGISDFIREKIGASYIPLPKNLQIRALLKDADGVSELNALGKFSLNYNIIEPDTHLPFRGQRLKNECAESYVFTDGCPFQPLHLFLVENGLATIEFAEGFRYGWSIDLPQGSYKPLQGSNKLRIAKSVQEKLKKFIIEIHYNRILYLETFGPQLTTIPHFDSASPSFGQLYPALLPEPPLQQELEQNLLQMQDLLPEQLFFLYYKPVFLKDHKFKSFLEFVNDAYKNMLVELNKIKIKCHKKHPLFNGEQLTEEFEIEYDNAYDNWKKELKTGTYKYPKVIERFVDIVIDGWFGSKVKNFKTRSPTYLNKKMQKTESTIENFPEIEALDLWNRIAPQKLLTISHCILHSYCNAFNAIQKRNENALKFEYDPKGPIASYNSQDHIITVNTAFLALSEILEIASPLIEGKDLSAMAKGNEWFLPTSKGAGYINHELEHARRSTGCSGGIKGAHSKDYNREGRLVPFEACASSYARYAYQSGLVSEWTKMLKEQLADHQIKLEDLQELHSLLQGVEKTHPKCLIPYVLTFQKN